MDYMCRTCMLNNAEEQLMEPDQCETEMISIFIVPDKGNEDKLSIMELMKTTVPQLKIEEYDKLPKKVCKKCLEKVIEIYNFQQKCTKIEETFYKLLSEAETFDNIENSEEKVVKTEVLDLADNCSMEFAYHKIIDYDLSSAEESNNSDDPIFDGNEGRKCKSQTIKKKKTNKESTNRGVRKKQKSSKRTAKSKQPDANELYPCGKCQRNLKSKISLIKHQEMHLKKDKEEQELKCYICNKEFSDVNTFKNHQQTHKGDKSFLCSECGKGFSSAGSLKQHSFRHLDKKLYKCKDCPKSFPTNGDLICHYVIHKAKPPIHVCEECGRGFYKPFLLKQHQRYHSNEKPFACEFCEKRFVTSEKQQRHMRTHTGEKPYRCKYCDRAFAQSNDCIKHLRQHLGDNVYQCELCPLRFPMAKDLRLHFATHKDDDDETKKRNLQARLEEERNLQIKLSSQHLQL